VLSERQLVQLRLTATAGLLPGEGDAGRGVGPDPEPEGVGESGGVEAEDVVGNGLEPDGDLSGGDRQGLSGADEERDTGPPP
jgi:hypothetical protein